MSRVVVMGSGETAPTMVRVHRDVLAGCPDGPAVLIDTPFAFQMNRDELVARTRVYFAQSVGREVDLVAWPPRETGAAAEEQALALLDRAAWAFAGPGSPTYALDRWRGTPVPAALLSVVRRGGTLVMGSAAALTLGSHSVPVYEIYKVGAAPEWVTGLDLLGDLAGIPVAVIPHYDNAEGGSHDTRFCYLGEPRLEALEARLPDEVGVLGVDEHTAVVLDLEDSSVRVLGNGTMSVRRRAATRTFAAGERLAIADLAGLLRGDEGVAASRPATVPDEATVVEPGGDPDREIPSLRREADAARAAFDAALARRDVDGCVTAVLGLEESVAGWRADTLQSDDMDEARRVLRALVVRLGEVAVGGARDPREQLAPYVDLLLDLRTTARDQRDFATSDKVRDRLTDLGVEVHDTPDGTSWDLTGV